MRAELTGVVLAGGASRRMGSDKALLDLDGRPLVERVAQRLTQLCVEVLVAPGPRSLPGLAWPVVADRAAGQGPLAGILGAAAVASTPLLAVVAVDMPDVSVTVLGHLAECWDGVAAAVVPVAGGRAQPLHAVVATDAHDALAAAFDAGERSVMRALTDAGAVLHPVADGPWAANLNTPADVRRYRPDG